MSTMYPNVNILCTKISLVLTTYPTLRIFVIFESSFFNVDLIIMFFNLKDGEDVNRKFLLDFLKKVAAFRFSKFFGYSAETHEKHLWLATKVAELMLEKLDEIYPGLAKEKIGNEFVIKKKLKAALVHKFSTDTEKRKDKLKLPTKKRGM